MRRVVMGIVISGFTLSAAFAQSVQTLPAVRPALLDVSDISGKAGKPAARLEVLSEAETVAVLPLVALQLLLAGLIGGATSESGIASVYRGGLTASGETARAGDTTAAHRSIPFGT